MHLALLRSKKQRSELTPKEERRSGSHNLAPFIFGWLNVLQADNFPPDWYLPLHEGHTISDKRFCMFTTYPAFSTNPKKAPCSFPRCESNSKAVHCPETLQIYTFIPDQRGLLVTKLQSGSSLCLSLWLGWSLILALPPFLSCLLLQPWWSLQAPQLLLLPSCLS